MLTLEHLADLVEAHRQAAKCQVKEFTIAGQHFAFNSLSAVMGVVNLSPDSWYRESVCLSPENAIRRGKVLFAQGAKIIDVGAESTLAKAALVDDTNQQKQLLPVVRG